MHKENVLHNFMKLRTRQPLYTLFYIFYIYSKNTVQNVLEQNKIKPETLQQLSPINLIFHIQNSKIK